VPAPAAVPLDGPLERGGFSPLTMAALLLVGALLATNVVGLLAALVAAVAEMRATGALDAEAVLARLTENPGAFLILNAIGQWLGFALLAVGVARGHSSRPAAFLRWRAPDAAGLGLAVLGLVALTPVVQWLGGLTETLPVPDWMAEMERSTTEIVERALLGADLGTPFLLLTMALTPAICEELLFRGYLHRQVERRLGAAWAIGLVGVVFGLYHLQPTKALPLAVLGVWLGYVTWATGSLWPAVAVHFLNNALAVVLAGWVTREAGGDLTALEEASVPLWAVALGAAGTLAAGWALRGRHAALAAASSAAPPPDASPP
jgi:membrane protease YdiL (CAAX protease family)